MICDRPYCIKGFDASIEDNEMSFLLFADSNNKTCIINAES